jgi:hypothetical protein
MFKPPEADQSSTLRRRRGTTDWRRPVQADHRDQSAARNLRNRAEQCP